MSVVVLTVAASTLRLIAGHWPRMVRYRGREWHRERFHWEGSRLRWVVYRAGEARLRVYNDQGGA